MTVGRPMFFNVLLLSLAAMALIACGAPARDTPQATPTPVALGAACAPVVRDEFVRQQQLVNWQVYCPTRLPGGLRLASIFDVPVATPHLGQDANPTLDELNPGGGTFTTRLTDGAGREVIVVQGAGASIYARRYDEPSLGPGGFRIEQPVRKVQFGDLQGGLFVRDPPAVIAFDEAATFGHMVIGIGLTSDEVVELAASMSAVGQSEPTPSR